MSKKWTNSFPCCPELKAKTHFYVALRFELVKVYIRPSASAVMRLDQIDMRFHGNKKQKPSENPTVCIMEVDDVGKVCGTFMAGLKNSYGAIPCSGIPRITTVRDLAEDRRFTLTDTGGNTIYVCRPNEQDQTVSMCCLESAKHAKILPFCITCCTPRRTKRSQPTCAQSSSISSHRCMTATVQSFCFW